MSKAIKILLYLSPIILALLSMLSILRPYYRELKFLFLLCSLFIYSFFKYSLESKKAKVSNVNQESNDYISEPNLIHSDQIPNYQVNKYYELDHLYFIHNKYGHFYFLLINYIANDNDLRAINEIFKDGKWFRMFTGCRYYFCPKTNSLHTEENLFENKISISSVSYSFIISKNSSEDSNNLSRRIRLRRHDFNYKIHFENFNLLRSSLIGKEHELSRFLNVDLKNNRKFSLGSIYYTIKTFKTYYEELYKSSDVYH